MHEMQQPKRFTLKRTATIAISFRIPVLVTVVSLKTVLRFSLRLCVRDGS